MATAAEYLERLKDLGLVKFELGIDTIDDAKAALADVRLKQKQVRQIKKEINLDMRAIRAEYQQRMETAGSGGSAFFTIFGQRKAAGQHRAAEKRKLRAERDDALQPYEALKVVLDDLLLQMDRAKVQIQGFIEEQKKAQ